MEKQVEKTDEYRIVKTYSFLGFAVANYTIYYTGKIFAKTIIRFRKVRTRYSEFDDGWSYQFYWSKWIESWELVDVYCEYRANKKNLLEHD